ncbi:MAG: hypothetical protein JSR66_01245 [Proteobacteria bacterium]|nr:hypothetical protein [Pseudomonadota bacterium]
MSQPAIYELAGGERVVWAEGSGAIVLKVREPCGDPVELGAAEALEVGGLLVRLAKEGCVFAHAAEFTVYHPGSEAGERR